ncbi:uncharacterized protein LOC114129394 [Aphis gossypii]|uniref:uncharacterized protein LOC114129394 n=1 Tax=Aphis gossypii TaxID=80765 RepID=UPI002158E162|nr:uncharacterized protein LOC114129394 [Aphis gossypii]
MEDLPEPEIEVVHLEIVEAHPAESGNLVFVEDENVEIVVVGAEAEELSKIILEDQALPQISGEEYDRCFVCWQRRDDVVGINIVLPCGHGWCCDPCARRLSKCPVCRVEYPRTLNINIMLTSSNNVSWIRNINSLMDPTGSNCICCWRAYRDAPNGSRCMECITSLPDICEVCDDTVDGVAQMFIS